MEQNYQQVKSFTEENVKKLKTSMKANAKWWQ